MFALEAYHRRAFPDRQKTMSKKVYRRFRETTLERMAKVAVWGRARDLFRSIVNEPSIGGWLLDITGRHEGMFPESYDIEANLSTIKRVRHTIAHSLSEDLSTTDIARAEILVRIIALAVLLETAGIDEEKGREILGDEYSGVDRIIELS
ncbi:HEPN domain-containing protein [Halobacterium salinarum]